MQDKLIALLLKNLIAATSLLETIDGRGRIPFYKTKIKDYNQAIMAGRSYFLDQMAEIDKEIEQSGKISGNEPSKNQSEPLSTIESNPAKYPAKMYIVVEHVHKTGTPFPYWHTSYDDMIFAIHADISFRFGYHMDVYEISMPDGKLLRTKRIDYTSKVKSEVKEQILKELEEFKD